MGGGCAALHHHVPSRPFSVTLEVTGNDSNKGPVTSSASPLLGSLAGASQAPETKPHPPVADKKGEHGKGGIDVPFSGHFTGNISHRGPLLACDMHFLPRMGSRMAIGGGIGLQGGQFKYLLENFYFFGVCGLRSTPSSKFHQYTPCFGLNLPILEGVMTKRGGYVTRVKYKDRSVRDHFFQPHFWDQL